MKPDHRHDGSGTPSRSPTHRCSYGYRFGTRYDPATPYRNAVKVHGLLPNSALITVTGVGHGSLFSSTCADRLIARYLLTGATPGAGAECRQDAGPFAPVAASVLGRVRQASAQAVFAAFSHPHPLQ